MGRWLWRGGGASADSVPRTMLDASGEHGFCRHHVGNTKHVKKISLHPVTFRCPAVLMSLDAVIIVHWMIRDSGVHFEVSTEKEAPLDGAKSRSITPYCFRAFFSRSHCVVLPIAKHAVPDMRAIRLSLSLFSHDFVGAIAP